MASIININIPAFILSCFNTTQVTKKQITRQQAPGTMPGDYCPLAIAYSLIITTFAPPPAKNINTIT